jgi:acyl-CoA synthetase (AMP-forming)/AMP-acid ligase II
LVAAFPRGGCLLLPSPDPADFLIGLIACDRAGVTATPWREGEQSRESVADVVRPDGILRLGDNALIEPVGTPATGSPRPGGLVMMTSGSTGSPKGVVLTIDQVILNAVSAGTAMEVWRCDGWAIEIDMALMSALSHMLMAWQFDLPLHHLTGRNDTNVARIFSGSNIGFGGSPVQLVRLCTRLPADSAPLMMVSSGDFLSPAMIDEIHAAFPNTGVHKLYGLTELAGRFCCMPHERLIANKAAVGWPLPGFEARIPHTATGEIGEIEARGPLLMAGYYHADGSFEAREPSWFPTGDVGFQDADGAITLVGRADDVVKVGGEKVDRQSIELALSDLITDREYCVLGVRHPLVGQCPALFIAAAPDGSEPPTWTAVVAHIRPKLPSRFIPGLMYRLEGPLPRLASGKIDRETLKSNHRSFGRLQ